MALFCQLKLLLLFPLALAGDSHDRSIVINALGRPFTLGSLYNARDEMIVPGSLWRKATLEANTTERTVAQTKYDVKSGNTLEDKLTLLDVDVGIKLSFLSGLITVTGSAKYLDEKSESNYEASMSLKYRSNTHWAQLEMDHLRGVEFEDELDKTEATHVVYKILYGAETVFTFKKQESSAERQRDVQGKLNIVVKSLPGTEIEGSGELKMKDEAKKTAESLCVTFHGDIRPEINPTTYAQAVRIYKELPNLIKRHSSVPVQVWMYPLSSLSSKAKRMVRQISATLVRRVEKVFSNIQDSQRTLADLVKFEAGVASLPSLEKQTNVVLNQLNLFEIQLRKKLLPILPEIRGGGKEEKKLADLLEQIERSPFNVQSLTDWVRFRKQEAAVLSKFLDYVDDIPVGLFQLHKRLAELQVNVVIAQRLDIGKSEDNLPERMAAFTSSNWQNSSTAKIQRLEIDLSDLRKSFRNFKSLCDINNAKAKCVVYELVQASKVGNVTAKTEIYEDGELLFPDFNLPEIGYTGRVTEREVVVKISAAGSHAVAPVTSWFMSVEDLANGTAVETQVNTTERQGAPCAVMEHGLTSGAVGVTVKPIFSVIYGRSYGFMAALPQSQSPPRITFKTWRTRSRVVVKVSVVNTTLDVQQDWEMCVCADDDVCWSRQWPATCGIADVTVLGGEAFASVKHAYKGASPVYAVKLATDSRTVANGLVLKSNSTFTYAPEWMSRGENRLREDKAESERGAWFGPSPLGNCYWTDDLRVSYSSAREKCLNMGCEFPLFDDKMENDYGLGEGTLVSRKLAEYDSHDAWRGFWVERTAEAVGVGKAGCLMATETKGVTLYGKHCLDDRWSICRKQQPHCTRPEIPNGKAGISSNQDPDKFVISEETSVTCNAGYTMFGTAYLTCACPGVWHAETGFPRCENASVYH